MNPPEDQRVGRLGSIGPAILIAAVVLGPGSILANSKVGWQYGYDMVWVLVVRFLPSQEKTTNSRM